MCQKYLFNILFSLISFGCKRRVCVCMCVYVCVCNNFKNDVY